MLKNNKSLILTFHGIGDYKKKLEEGEERVWVSKSNFLEFCRFAADRDDIKITFDDGNVSDIEVALPALVKNNLKATFFVVADRIGENNYLCSDHINTLKQNGMIIGSHGMHHRPWRGLSDKEFDIELFNARGKIEDITGEKIILVSCPFGTYNRRILKKIKLYKYEHMFTSDGGVINTDSFIQHRNTIHYNENVLSLLKQIKDYKSNKLKTLWRDFKCLIKTTCL